MQGTEPMESKREKRVDLLEKLAVECVRLYDEQYKTINEIAKQIEKAPGFVVQCLVGTFKTAKSERYKWCSHYTRSEDLKLLRKLRKEGNTYEQIAEQINISSSSVERKLKKVKDLEVDDS
jgi:DNA-binding NarL/FixJ family response regulator